MDTHLRSVPSDDLGTGAVEIAAMLGDSVVGVKHCVDPRSGKISRLTYGLFAAGLACMLASAIAFVISVRAVAFNAGKLAYWTQVEHKPARAFRPDDVGVGVDAIAFAGLALALVGLTTALVRARGEKRSPYYRIGTAPGVEQPALGAPTASFPLVAPVGDEFVFNYGAGIDGEMILDGASTSFAQLAATGRARPSATTAGAIEVPIPARARIRARVGQTTFLVSAVGKPRKQATAAFAAFETRAAVYFGASLAAHLAIWAVLQAVPVENTIANLELDSNEGTDVRLTGTTVDTTPPPVEPPTADKADTGGSTGTAMALAGGGMGKPTSDRESGRYKLAQTTQDPALARIQAIEEARSAGIMGSTLMTEGSTMASITGTASIASGFDDATIYGGLIGNEAGEMKGGFGYARWGFGPGGDGTGWGTVGTGRFNTIGQGTGTGDGYQPGGGHRLGGPKHQQTIPTAVIGKPINIGDGLDKSIIRRYIMRNLEKITYCYEKQLAVSPTLAGTVTVAFFIAPDGSVGSSTGSGLDGDVSSCVAGVVKSISFPRPTDGGGVQVNYPFTFHATK